MQVTADASELVIGFEHLGGAPVQGRGPASGKTLAPQDGRRASALQALIAWARLLTLAVPGPIRHTPAHTLPARTQYPPGAPRPPRTTLPPSTKPQVAAVARLAVHLHANDVQKRAA